MTGDGDLLPDLNLPGLDPVALARAEAALAALSDNYLAWADADLARLRAALDPFRPDMLFTIAHDMKGQAGTFGFPLVTELANSLCRLLEGDRDDVARATLLVELLGEAVSRRLDGDGGEDGRRLIERIPSPARCAEEG